MSDENRSRSRIMHLSDIKRLDEDSTSERSTYYAPSPKPPSFLEKLFSGQHLGKLVAASTAACVLTFICARMHVASASEIIVRTGPFIKQTQVRNWCVQWPLYKVSKISTRAKRLHVHPETKFLTLERHPVEFATKLTVSVDPTNIEDVRAYSRQFLENDTEENPATFEETMDRTVDGVVRLLVAGTSSNDLLASSLELQNKINDRLSIVFGVFGVRVSNISHTNIVFDQSADVSGLQSKTEYSSRVLASTQIIAANETAAAVIAAERKRDQDIRIAEIAAETAKAQANLRQRLVEYNANVANTTIETKRDTDTRGVAATQSVALRKAELEAAVRKQEQLTELESNRIKESVVATARAERVVIDARASGDQLMIAADAELQKQKTISEAKLIDAEKVAAGTEATLRAEAAGLEAIGAALGGAEHVLPYIMLQKNLPGKISESAAQAFRNMNATVLSTDSGNKLAGLFGDVYAAIKAVSTAGMPMPPMLSFMQPEKIKPPTSL